MNIISNYARNLELNKYSTINESSIFEADSDSAKALDQVKSGKAGGTYANQWSQVEKAVVSAYEAGQTTGTLMVKHDNGTDMVNVSWKITDGKVELSSVSKPEEAKAASQKIKDAAQKIWVALEGSMLGEEEEDVYAVLRDEIKTEADLQSLLNYWKSLKIPFIALGDTRYDRTSLEKTAAKFSKGTPNQINQTLDFWLKGLFNKAELNKVNDVLAQNNIQYRFKIS